MPILKEKEARTSHPRLFPFSPSAQLRSPDIPMPANEGYRWQANEGHRWQANEGYR